MLKTLNRWWNQATTLPGKSDDTAHKTDDPEDVNPVILACAIAGYEATRAFVMFFNHRDPVEVLQWDYLPKHEKAEVLEGAMLVMQGCSAQKLSEVWGDKPYAEMLPYQKIKYSLFLSAVAAVLKSVQEVAAPALKDREEVQKPVSTPAPKTNKVKADDLPNRKSRRAGKSRSKKG